tara:strand:- start:484 stop:684 length:201 start_codon:yes stop_codon:yes gene_type:complete
MQYACKGSHQIQPLATFAFAGCAKNSSVTCCPPAQDGMVGLIAHFTKPGAGIPALKWLILLSDSQA